MEIGDTYAIVYFSVFFVLAIASWLFFRRLDPKGKKKWQPRLSLLSIVIIGPFLLLPPLAMGHWEFALIGGVVIGLLGFGSIKLTRVCEACGHIAQPQNLFSVASFCPKCGAKLTPSRLLGSHDG